MNLRPPGAEEGQRNGAPVLRRLLGTQLTSERFDDIVMLSGCAVFLVGAVVLGLLGRLGYLGRPGGFDVQSVVLLIEYAGLGLWCLSALYGAVRKRPWAGYAVGCWLVLFLATYLPRSVEPWAVFALVIGMILYPRIRNPRVGRFRADKSAGSKG